MLTITGIARGGGCTSTIWYRVAKRDAVTLQNLVKKHTVQSKRTVVCTDGWRAYRGLGDTVRHRTVNHSISGKYRFVTEEGVHTNHAESALSSVKRSVRRQGRLSMKPREAEKCIALYTLWFKRATWQERLQSLLLCLKFGQCLPNIKEEDNESETEEEEQCEQFMEEEEAAATQAEDTETWNMIKSFMNL